MNFSRLKNTLLLLGSFFIISFCTGTTGLKGEGILFIAFVFLVLTVAGAAISLASKRVNKSNAKKFKFMSDEPEAMDELTFNQLIKIAEKDYKKHVNGIFKRNYLTFFLKHPVLTFFLVLIIVGGIQFVLFANLAMMYRKSSFETISGLGLTMIVISLIPCIILVKALDVFHKNNKKERDFLISIRKKMTLYKNYEEFKRSTGNTDAGNFKDNSREIFKMAVGETRRD